MELVLPGLFGVLSKDRLDLNVIALLGEAAKAGFEALFCRYGVLEVALDNGGAGVRHSQRKWSSAAARWRGRQWRYCDQAATFCDG